MISQQVRTIQLMGNMSQIPLFQDLTESTETSDNLSKNLLRDGYVFIRKVYRKNDIQNAKENLFKSYTK